MKVRFSVLLSAVANISLSGERCRMQVLSFSRLFNIECQTVAFTKIVWIDAC